MRCEYCEWRDSWDCEGFWKSDNTLCLLFRLDFDSLTGKQKLEIQKRLMGASNETNY